MRALVTGSNGFLGRRLVAKLREDGHEVTGLDLPEGNIEDPHLVEFACRDVDVVFHTAARAQLGGTYEQFYRTNVQGTLNVLKFARKVVYTSSASVVFAGRDLRNVDETWPIPRRHLNHYCATKARAEQLVLQAGGVAIRPHLIWGAGERKLIPGILNIKRFLARVGPGQNVIDTSHVDNVVHAHLLAVGHHGVYTVTDGSPVRMWDWLEEFVQRPIRRHVPYPLIYALGALLERLPGEPPLSRYLAAQLVRTHTSDITKAIRELGYRPVVTRSQGMEELLAYLNKPGRPC